MKALNRVIPAHHKKQNYIPSSLISTECKIMRLPEQNFIQRKCIHCEKEEQVSRKPLTSFMQRKADNAGDIANANVSNRIQSTQKNGSPLPERTKNFMESRFGSELSHVRIHADSEAAALSTELSAQAFTVGNHIYFNQGKYAPESSTGKQLLAHELTHTIQQSGAANENQIQRDDMPPGTIGTGVLRINDQGRVEFILGTPNLPVLGSVGVGFRCENGRCQPIGSQNPFSDSSKKSYTLDEARELLSGIGGGASTGPKGSSALPGLGSAATPNLNIFQLPCPPGQRRNTIGLCELNILPIPNTTHTPAPGPLSTAFPGLSGRPYSGLNLHSIIIDHFTQGSSQLPSNTDTVLQTLVASINALQPGVMVHIDGHASTEGTGTRNRMLTQERSDNVKDRLRTLGVTDPQRLHAFGKGEEEPLISPEGTEEDRAKNRRVEVWYFDNSSTFRFNLNTPPLFPITP